MIVMHALSDSMGQPIMSPFYIVTSFDRQEYQSIRVSYLDWEAFSHGLF